MLLLIIIQYLDIAVKLHRSKWVTCFTLLIVEFDQDTVTERTGYVTATPRVVESYICIDHNFR